MRTIVNNKFICEDMCFLCDHRLGDKYTCTLNGKPKVILTTNKSSTTCSEYQ